MQSILPYKEKNTSKKEQVAEMFNNISAKYDFLNHFLSAGIDYYWRYRALQKLKKYQPKTLLDVATGTADLALQSVSLRPEKITGVDISEGMLEIGRKKVKNKRLAHLITLLNADAENLPFAENSFQAVMVAFGVRNFENLTQGLSEIRRVLEPGKPLLILEFSKPKKFPMKHLFQFYFTFVLPFIGKIVSKDNSAYSYLPESVQAFPEGKDLIEILKTANFNNCSYYPLTFGICTIYLAEKPYQ